MIWRNFVKYINNPDPTKIPLGALSAPTQNFIIKNGSVFTRPGIVSDGTNGTGNARISGRINWKDAPSGKRRLKVDTAGNVYMRINAVWIPLGQLPNTNNAVRFATWIDSSALVVKKRCFFVDGSDKIYEWTGAVGKVLNGSGTTINFSDSKTPIQLGFDQGHVTPTQVYIAQWNGTTYTLTNNTIVNDLTSNSVTLGTTLSSPLTANDYVVAKIVTHSDKLTGVKKDDVYTWKNSLGIGSLSLVRVHFSSKVTKLDFVVPASNARTAVSPFTVDLPGNFTAMISKNNTSSDENILWISDTDGWTKVKALLNADSDGYWFSVNRVFEEYNTGSLPFCTMQVDGNIRYIRQDLTVYDIQTLDVLNSEKPIRTSDDVELDLKYINKLNATVYKAERYSYFIFPQESKVFMRDDIGGYWLPPQLLPISMLDDGEDTLTGYSNVNNGSFIMFRGRTDLGAQITAKIQLPWYDAGGLNNGVPAGSFKQKQHERIMMLGRMTESTKVGVKQYFDYEGVTAVKDFEIDGRKITYLSTVALNLWAQYIFGFLGYGSVDDDVGADLKLFVRGKIRKAVPYLHWGALLDIGGENVEFHLLQLEIDDKDALHKAPDSWILPND